MRGFWNLECFELDYCIWLRRASIVNNQMKTDKERNALKLTRELLAEMDERELNILAAKTVGKNVRMLNEVTGGAFRDEYDRPVIDLGDMRYEYVPLYSTSMSEAATLLQGFDDAVLRVTLNDEYSQIYTIQIGHVFLLALKLEEWPKIITQAVILATQLD